MVEKQFVVSSKSLLPCREILYILGALWWGMQGKGQLLCVLQVAVEVRLEYSPSSISAILSYLCLRDKMTIHSESHLTGYYSSGCCQKSYLSCSTHPTLKQWIYSGHGVSMSSGWEPRRGLRPVHTWNLCLIRVELWDFFVDTRR